MQGDGSEVRLAISRRALKKLGERLAAEAPTSNDDLDLLAAVLKVYNCALGQTKVRVDKVVVAAGQRLGLALTPSTSRLKTTGTLIEKLRRQPHLGLGNIQDIAGLRIVGDITYRDQNRVCDLLGRVFRDEPKPPRRRDRRDDPSSGYRALHIVVYPSDIPVEIQIRTLGQQQWANFYERLADLWGRQIRYGEEPHDPDALVGRHRTRREVIQRMLTLSDMLDQVERSRVELLDLQREIDDLEVEAQEDMGALEDVRRRLADTHERFGRRHSELVSALELLSHEIAQSVEAGEGGEHGLLPGDV